MPNFMWPDVVMGFPVHGLFKRSDMVPSVKGLPLPIMKRFVGTLAVLPVFLFVGMLVLSGLSRASGTESKGQIVLYSYGPARVQIISPDGLRAGADLVTGGELEEIKGADVAIEKAGDRSDSWTVTLKGPTPGVYRFKLLGMGAGGVVMDLQALDFLGRVSSSNVFKRVMDGDCLEYALNYSPEPKSENILKEVSN
jgi:hypothetical protein